ncbi:hypothetical protein PITCH_A650009 [uncultured Desulfobacterium sp.]|uniref:Uncharacterized protein n=1 Tax=uncultured Desulfobacterium sp. TaxID=201089 RepID=A0A445N1L1_9BACT|nr:hypothetical protein PITCH_A650009 [uncultured Desulfobacterium sp.]
MQFETIVGAVFHTAAAVDADKGLSPIIQINGVNRAGRLASATKDAELFLNHNTSAPTL